MEPRAESGSSVCHGGPGFRTRSALLRTRYRRVSADPTRTRIGHQAARGRAAQANEAAITAAPPSRYPNAVVPNVRSEPMLHSVLFVATIPERDDQNRWQNVLNNLPPQMRSPTVAIERLAENVWLLRLSSSLAPLGHLISRCEQFGIVYRILPFDG